MIPMFSFVNSNYLWKHNDSVHIYSYCWIAYHCLRVTMEYWIFTDEELSIIADLMIDKLKTLPHNSELSVIDLFVQTFDAEYIDIKEGGKRFRGYKISDVNINDGRHLHDVIEWNFDNAIWEDTDGQAFDLNEIVIKRARIAGYIVDHAQKSGLKLGLPQYIPSFYRKKKEFIVSFNNIKEIEHAISQKCKYYTRHKDELVHYHREYNHTDTYYTEIYEYDSIHKHELWRIPIGCTTGKVKNVEGRVSVYVIKGRCLYESSRWDHAIYYPEKRASWKEKHDKIFLKGNSVEFHKGSYKRKKDGTIIKSSWFQLTNIGKSELLVLVIDANKTEFVYYAPLMGISRHRISTDGTGICTLLEFYGCCLDCKYCLNPQCKKVSPKLQYMSAKDIVDIAKKDELYQIATKEGITFGGGEPLLKYDFLMDSLFGKYGHFCHITVETTLQIMPGRLWDLDPYIDEYIVDIKDLNPHIYEAYTGIDGKEAVDLLKTNLRWLIEHGKASHITCRIPLIPGFNTPEDQQLSKKELEAMGITRFDLFRYQTTI